jgi:uncharacterized protein involved in outer membrane biogenesis
MRWLKKIALLTGGLLLLLLVVLVLYTSLRQEKITEALTRKVNESVNTRISYGSFRLTVLSTFPNIGARFDNLLVAPSPYYDRTQFAGDNTDTLLYASSLSLKISLPSLLTGTVAVKAITVSDGEITMLTDKRGDINFEVLANRKGGGKNVRLKNISAKNITVMWHDRSSEMRIAGNISQATLGGEIFRTGIFLNAALSATLDSATVGGMDFRDLPASASLRMRKSANSFSIAKGALELAGLDFDIDGNVNFSAKKLDLTVTGQKIEISTLSAMLPERWGALTGSFTPSGILDLGLKVNGPYGEAGGPHFDLNFGLTGGRMSHTASGFRVNSLEFVGGMTNGERNGPETFRFTLDRLDASYGSAKLKGSFMLNNLTSPHIILSLDGDLDFDDLGKIMKPGIIHDQTGLLSGSIRLSGTLPDTMKLKAAALPLLNPEISLLFRDFGASFGEEGPSLTGMNGSVKVMTDLVADSLSLTYADQHFIIDASMRDFTPWLSGRPVMLYVSGDVTTDMFIPEKFAVRDTVSERSEGRKPDIFPASVSADVRFAADSMVFKGFRASDLKTSFDYRPYVFTFKDISARGLGGLLVGELMLGKQKEGDYIARVRLDVEDTDINRAFTAFNNFGQSFIVSDNLQGNLTGSLNLLAPLDSLYRIIGPELIAEAHLVITEGRLTEFGPAEELSSYLDLDELKDIYFSRMENDLFIKNETVSIPRMLINSSAVNFTLYGSHKFNNDYSYHLRLLLSEVMSRKARDRNRGVSSFGQVTVDGSGKATVPLKIVCVGGETEVKYDFGQAQDNIKTDIALEKQELKGILNEEYGWYRSDTLITKPAEGKPRFSITWEEGKEGTTPAAQSQEEVKESPLKILLRKKR